MRLSNLFVVTFGIGVLSYPAIQLPQGKPFFAKEGTKRADPAPPEKKTKTDFAIFEELANTPKEKNYRIVINIPATRLTLYEDNDPVMDLPVAVGQEIYKTPTGHDEIKELIWNPWWYPPKSDWAKDEVVTPPGPKNPLGPVKLVLGDEIRIHGTSKPWSIGRPASHGCIRMYSKDAVELAWYLQGHLTDKSDPSYMEKYKKFASTSFRVKLRKPVPVDLVYQPIAFNDELITIYPDIYGRLKDMKDAIRWMMFANGVDPWGFDLTSIAKAKTSPLEIPLEELK